MKRNTYKAEFKSKVVLELLSGQYTLNELAGKYQFQPTTLSGNQRLSTQIKADLPARLTWIRLGATKCTERFFRILK